jgi:TldD protein
MKTSAFALASFVVLCIILGPASAQKTKPASPTASAESVDPILRAMQSELDRSKSRLKMDNVPAPYYIEYRLADEDDYTAEAAFGALRQQQRTHGRSVRVVVRVGDYKQDSYYNQGMGLANVAPLDDASIPLERELWLATDIAYKRASEALAAKKAVLSQYTADQPFDDFAHAPRLESLDPLVKLDLDPAPWSAALERATDLFRTDPKIESLSATFHARAVNQYFVNTEGTVTRRGYTVFQLNLTGSTQAGDGMRIERSPYYSSAVLSEMPNEEHLLADTHKMLDTLKALREAHVVEEEYRGPVLFSSDAADDVFASLIGSNVLGRRPKPGASARTEGPFASSYKSRVLPNFVSIVDDPSLKTFEGKTLIGSYDTDDEGVRAVAVPVVENGELDNYLLGREPIRDFSESNGHGRGGPGQPPAPALGNLIVKAKQAASFADLKQQLIDLCRQKDRPYGYFVDTLGPGLSPRLLYRVYAKDGHEEIVRGGVFSELDVRTLRNDLIALGNDPLVSNREGPVPSTVIAPSILFDELEVKRTDAKNAKLPEYPPPPLPSAP